MVPRTCLPVGKCTNKNASPSEQFSRTGRKINFCFLDYSCIRGIIFFYRLKRLLLKIAFEKRYRNSRCVLKKVSGRKERRKKLNFFLRSFSLAKFHSKIFCAL